MQRSLVPLLLVLWLVFLPEVLKNDIASAKHVLPSSAECAESSVGEIGEAYDRDDLRSAGVFPRSGGNGCSGQKRAESGEQRVSTREAPLGARDWELQGMIEDFLRSRSGVYGVTLQNLDTGQTVLINEDLQFLAASTYKVLVMYKAYEALETGVLSGDDLLTVTESDTEEEEPYGGFYPGERVPVADALEAMVTASDNAAAYALTRVLGGWGVIEAAAEELGMSKTRLEDGYFWTTPVDMQTFFAALAESRLVSAEASHQMVDLLRRQRLNDEIPALLPAGAEVAHKTGKLPGVTNDAGIVYGPGGAYIICVFSQSEDEDEAASTIAQVALLAYARYAS